MGFNDDCNVFGNSYSNDDSESANAVSIAMPHHGNFALPVDNGVPQLDTNRLEQPLRTENIWQDHERLQFQQQVNTWNIMRYRMQKIEQQQHLIQQYRNDWRMVNQMPQEVRPAASIEHVHHISPYLRCLGHKGVPATLNSDNTSTNTIQQRRTRISFTNQQYLILEHAFQYNRYLNKLTLEYLSNELGITEKQVKIWFQNRRVRKIDCSHCLIRQRLSRRRRT